MIKTKANIYSKTQHIGKATLSVGDFTMGGIVGEFYPNDFYITEIQPLIWQYWDNGQANQYAFFTDKLQLQVQLENGLFLMSVGGIWIEDFLDNEPFKRLEMSGVNTFWIENYIIENQPLTLNDGWQTLDIEEKKHFEKCFYQSHFQSGFTHTALSAMFKHKNGQIAFEIHQENIEQSYCIVYQDDMTDMQLLDNLTSIINLKKRKNYETKNHYF